MKKAIRSGIGVGILPEFAVHDELKDRILDRVHVKGANFTSRVVLVKTRKLVSPPTVEDIRRILIEGLISGQSAAETSHSDTARVKTR
jgi:DNA-binding transcriptional LysR family regulator